MTDVSYSVTSVRIKVRFGFSIANLQETRAGEAYPGRG